MPEREALLFWSNALEAQEIARRLSEVGMRCQLRRYGDVRAEDAGRDKVVETGVIPAERLEALRHYAEAPTVKEAARLSGMSDSQLKRCLCDMRETLGCETNRQLILVAARLELI